MSGSVNSQSIENVGNTLNDFSGNLIEFLQSVTIQMTNMQKSQDAMIYTIQNLESNLQVTTRELAHLRSDANDQKKRLDEVTSSVILVNPMGSATTNFQSPSAISFPTSSYNDDDITVNKDDISTSLKSNNSISQVPIAGILISPPSTTSDMKTITPSHKVHPVSKEFSLKFQLGKALNDAVLKYSTHCNARPSSSSTSLPEQINDEKIDKIETTLALQENINKISAAIVKSNNETSLYNMDQVQNQIKKLENDLSASKAESEILKTAISDVYAKFIMFANTRTITPSNNRSILGLQSSKSVAVSKSTTGTPLGTNEAATNNNGNNNAFWNTSPANANASVASSLMKDDASPIRSVASQRSILDTMVDIDKSQAVANERSIALQMLEAVMPPQPVLDDETRKRINVTEEKTVMLERTMKKMSKAIENIMSQIEEVSDRSNNSRSYSSNNDKVSAVKTHADTPRSMLPNDNNKISSKSSYSITAPFGTRNLPFMNKVNNVRDRWLQIISDMKYGLLRHAVEAGHISNFPNILEQEPPETKGSSVLHKAEEFTILLADAIRGLENVDASSDDTGATIFQPLDHITVCAEELIALDDTCRLNENRQNLDGLYCEDGNKVIRDRMNDAMKLSGRVLEEIDDKVFLKRRIDKLDKALHTKAEFASIKHMEAEFRRLVSTKLDRQDLISALEKKASLSDIDKLREQLNRNLATIRQGDDHIIVPDDLHSPSASTSSDMMKLPLPSSGAVPSSSMIATFKELFNKEIIDLTQRFELLNRHFKDLELYCDSFVPRSEVEEAMHALFQEVKNIKSHGVTHNMFKDGLRLKADAVELERLVQSLTSAVGELNTLGEASALHQRCLVCDKPVSSLTKSRHPNQLGYDKVVDEVPEHDNRVGTSVMKPSSSIERLGSPDRNISNKEKIKISTDITVMKNTIDLPPINDVAHSKGYHQRVRSSAGGGMGTWTMDTR